MVEVEGSTPLVRLGAMVTKPAWVWPTTVTLPVTATSVRGHAEEPGGRERSA